MAITWPSGNEARAAVERHGGNRAQAAREFGINPRTFRDWLARDVAEPDDAERTIDADPLELGDAAALMRKHGMVPEQWTIRNPVVLNTWGGVDGADNAQIKVKLDQRHDLLLPARADGWRAPKRAKLDRSKPFMFAAVGDRHCPDHDEGLHAAMCEWLRQFEPELFVDLGDLMDMSGPSRHRSNPARPQSIQSCVDTGYAVKRAEVEASPGTRHVLVPGNHDFRLRNDAIDRRPGSYGLRRADNPDGPQEEWPVESLPHLLRLDELGVKFIGGDDDYDQYEFEIAPGIVGLHGYRSRPKAGQTVAAMVESYAMSVVMGHVHRQGITPFTWPDAHDGARRQYWGMEAGAGYRRGDNLGYDHRGGNHQHGFGTGIVWPDGRHLFELASWDGVSLTWRAWRCTP